MKKKFSLLDIDIKKLKNSKSIKAERHGYHIVEPSPWPFITATSIANLVMLCLFYFHYFKITNYWIFFVITYFSLVIGMWFRDVVVEATFQGFHTSDVQRGLRYGMALFLISEFMFFFSLIYVNKSDILGEYWYG